MVLMELKRFFQQEDIRKFILRVVVGMSIVMFIQIVIELQFTLLEVVLLLYVAVDLFEEYILSIIREII